MIAKRPTCVSEQCFVNSFYLFMSSFKKTAEKLGSLQRGNCNNRISWSKNGTVAFIKLGKVYLTFLTCKDGEIWEFSEPSLLNIIKGVHGNDPVMHVSWSSLGGDLACIDRYGRISISALNAAGIMTSLYSPTTASQGDNMPASALSSEIDSIVGFSWLDPDKPILLASPATRTETPHQGGSHNALYGVSQGKQAGPAHPLGGKQACIALTKRGQLKLISQIASDARYYECSVWLESVIEQKETDLISHATWKGCKDNILLVIIMIPAKSIVRVYKVSIQWTSQATGKPTGVPQAAPNEFARIIVERVLQTTVISPIKDSMYITHLQAIAGPPSKSPTQVETSHELYAVYSNGTQSLIQKYEITFSPATFHSNFFQLIGGQRNSDSKLQLWKTQPVDAPQLSKVPVLSIGTAGYDTYVCVLFADGSVKSTYRSQSGHPLSKNTIMSLSDVGYKFPILGEVSDMCLSSNLLSYAYLDGKDTLQVNYMKNTSDYNIKENVISSAIALAVRHSISCFSNLSGDDILIVMKRELSQMEKSSSSDSVEEDKTSFLNLLLQESHRAINFTLDTPKDYQIDKIVVNPSLQRLLSMQMILGTSSAWKKNSMSRVAWGALNLRLLAFGITFTLRATSQSKHLANGISEVEVKSAHVLSMMGLIRWCTDFLAYCCQELYLASIDMTDFYYDKSSNSSLVMCLLLGKVPRTLLIFSLRGIRGLENVVGRLAELEPSNLYVRGVAQRIKDAVNSSLVPLNQFEKMVTDLDTSLKSISSNLPDRLLIEQSLMFDAKIPTELYPIAKRALEVFQKSLVPEIDVPQLHFHDVSWLGLDEIKDISDDKLSRFIKETEFEDKIDVLRKQVISPGTGDRLRRCVRCGGSSIWDDIKSLAFTQWTVAFQKTCLCGGNWLTAI